MKTLDEVREYFKDKNVLIVGNSVEMFNHMKGDYIDSFDIVIRLGQGIRTRGRHEVLGTKSNVWASGDFRLKEYFDSHLDDTMSKLELILFNPNRLRLGKNHKPQWFDRLPENLTHAMFTDQELIEKNEKWNYTGWSNENEKRTARLSGGMVCIMFMVEKVKTYKSLELIGFDFFKKHTKQTRRDDQIKHHSWHRPIREIIWENDRYKWDHDHKNEKGYVLQAQSEGLLKWNILSDLEEESIDEPRFTNY